MPSQSNPRDRLDPQLIRLGLVLVLGIVMSMLDTTIVNVALRTLGRELKAPLPTVQWVVTGYMLALAMVIPTAAWVVDRFGGRQVFLGSVALFTAGSLACSLAWDSGSLIAFRLVQGGAGALLMPVAQTILAQEAGPSRMGRVMALVGLPALLAPIFGPMIGGLIVDHLSWRWIFLIDVPVGVLSLPLIARVLPRGRTAGAGGSLDVRGLALLSPALALMVYGLSRAGNAGTFATPQVWATVLGGIVLLALFTAHALGRGDRALIPVRYFRDRVFTAASLATIVIGVSVFGVMLLLPLYYQQIRHQTALGAGLLIAPQGLGTMLSMPIAGLFADRLGARYVVLTGMTLTAVGTLALTQITATTSYWLLGGVLFLRGLGFGATMMPAVAASYRNLPRSAAGHASAATQIFSRVGGTMGAALMAVILTQNLTAHPTAPVHAYTTAFWWGTAITAAGILFALPLPGRPAADPLDPGRTSHSRPSRLGS